MLDWQQKAIDRIHVHQIDGPSTLLFFNKYGHLQSSYNDYWTDRDGQLHEKSTSFSIPIEYFDPKNEAALSERLKTLAKQKKLDRRFYESDREFVKYYMNTMIEEARDYLKTTRPEQYRYAPTPEEERQIARIFVELNKYPEIASVVTKESDFLWLIPQANQHINSMSSYAAHVTASSRKSPELHYYVAGYFSKSYGLIISDSNETSSHTPHADFPKYESFRYIVSEETIHAFDHIRGISDKALEVKPKDIEEASAHSHALEQWFDRKDYDGMPRANIRFSDQEKTTLRVFEKKAAGLAEQVEQYKIAPDRHKKSQKMRLLPEYYTIALGLSAANQLQDAADFEKIQMYNEKTWPCKQAEFFTKNLKYLLLTRHNNKALSPEQYSEFENTLFATPYQQRLSKFADQIKQAYTDTYTDAARANAEEWVESIAKKLEKEHMGMTNYSFKRPQPSNPFPQR